MTSQGSCLLHRWRKGRGWTQVKAAEVIGIDQARYSQYEGGKRKPGLQRAIRIEQATGGFVSVETWHAEELADGKVA